MGHVIFFGDRDSRLWFADYEARGDSSKVGKPQLWNETPIAPQMVSTAAGGNYDISSDGTEGAGEMIPLAPGLQATVLCIARRTMQPLAPVQSRQGHRAP